MRKLSILRTKSFVGCLAKMKIYIEDPSSDELMINGTPCRKLGVIKNGETKEFEIGDEASKVFVIADKLSKNYCNEFYALPEGSDDIYLSGKNHYNPAGGNPFLFDANNTEETKANRKKNTRRGAVILIAAVIVGIVIGLLPTIISLFEGRDNGGNAEKVFTAEEMSITLTEEFQKLRSNDFVGLYESDDMLVLVSKDLRADVVSENITTAEQYGEYILSLNEMNDEIGKNSSGVLYFEYEAADVEDESLVYSYVAYLYESDDAFWMVQFAIDKADYAELFDVLDGYANTVTFS